MPRLFLLLGVLLAAVAPTARAQIGISTGDAGNSIDDSKDLDEVDDVDEEEYLPFTGEDGEGGAEVRRAQRQELALSQAELRARHDYAVSVSYGPTKPWQTYSFELASFLTPYLALGAYAGSEGHTDAGIIDERAYDLKIQSRSAGLAARLFSTLFPRLAVEADLGYATWESKISPHGGALDLGGDPATKLSTGFRGHGPVLGVEAEIAFLWEGGVQLSWVPFGVRVAKAVAKDFDHETPVATSAILTAVERPSLYGLTNLTLGYLF